MLILDVPERSRFEPIGDFFCKAPTEIYRQDLQDELDNHVKKKPSWSFLSCKSCKSCLTIGAGFYSLNPGVDALFEHVHRQSPGTQHFIVESADVELITKLRPGLLAQAQDC